MTLQLPLERKEQEGRCVVCDQPLRIAEEDLHIHHRIWRSRGGPDNADNLELLHANCHREIHVQERLTRAAASCEGRLWGLELHEGVTFTCSSEGRGWR